MRALAIIPAGTANLFASNLGIPQDIEAGGRDRAARATGATSTSARFNGERFAVMAGAGFDAAMIRDAGDGGLKERFGRAAYVWTRLREPARRSRFGATIEVDGAEWFKGEATCILLGNVGKLVGGVEVFEDARPDDGKLEVGVVTADGVLDWSRMIGGAQSRVRSATRRSRRQPRRAPSRSSSRGRFSTSSTAATGRR